MTATASGGRLAQAHLICVLLMLVAGYLSIAVSQILLGLGLALLIVRVARRETTLPHTGLGVTAALLALWAAAVLPFSLDPGQSLVYYRRFYLFSAVWSVAAVAVDDRRRTWLLWALLIGSLSISLFSQIKAVAVTGSLFGGRMRDVFNPMTSGALLMMPPLVVAGFLLERRLPRRTKILLAVAAAPVLLGLVQTLTRSALLGFAVGVALILLRARPRWFLVLAAVTVVAVGVIVLWGDAFLPDLVARRIDPQFLVSGRSTSERVAMWRSGWEMFRDHPWIGVGDHDLTALSRQYQGDGAAFHYGHLHSNFVQIAVIWGAPGLLLGTAFLLAPGWLLLRRLRSASGDVADPGSAWALGALGVWAAFLVAGLTEWYFGDAEAMLIYLAILGAGLAPRGDREPSGS